MRQERRKISKILDTFPKVKEATVLTLGNSHKAMESSDAILVASGTATLEAALYKKPLVVGYAMPALSAMLILSKGQTKWISLPNILAQKTLVPECVQMFCNPDILASHILHALEPSRAENAFVMFLLKCIILCFGIHLNLLPKLLQMFCTKANGLSF